MCFSSRKDAGELARECEQEHGYTTKDSVAMHGRRRPHSDINVSAIAPLPVSALRTVA